MNSLRVLVARVVACVRCRSLDDALDQEMRSHLAMLEAEHVSRGVSPDEARAAARRDFGGMQQATERHRDQRGLPWFEDLRRDVRHALHALARTPGFAFAVIGILAVGIGANVAVFSAVNGILLRPLPYEDSDRLVHIIETIPAAESMLGMLERADNMDPTVYAEWRARTRTLSHMALSRPASMTLSGSGDTVRLNGSQASTPLFPMLRVEAAIGRVFEPREEKPGADHVVILSYGTWQTRFGGDPSVLGRSVSLDGAGYTVIGVMPREFAFPDALTDFWVPLALTFPPGQVLRLGVLARVKPEVTLEAAAAEARVMSKDLLGEPRVDIVRWKDELVAPVRPALMVFAGAVTLVLLVACVNIASLFRARARVRQREMAVRMALGAGRGRVLRQLVTESLVMTLIGGLAGWSLAAASMQVLRGVGHGLNRVDLVMDVTAPPIPRLDEIGLDTSSLLYVSLIVVGTGLVFGLSAWRGVRRTDLVRAARTHALLITGQVALTMMLLLGAGLLIRSFANLTGINPGYDPRSVMTFSLPESQRTWSFGDLKAIVTAQRSEVERAERIVARLQSVPGVYAGAFTGGLPMTQLGFNLSLRTTPDATPVQIPRGKMFVVGRDYFNVMGIRVIRGRGFADGDRSRQRGTFVINRKLASVYFGDTDPMGRSLYLSRNFVGDVVGVVDDVRQSSLDVPAEPQLFVTAFQTTREFLPIGPDGMYIALRTDRDAATIVPEIRRIVREIDPDVPVHNIATMDQIVANSISTPRSYAVLLGLFALMALILASAGLYSLLAYLVGQRTREIGVRMALGAQRREVVLLVARQGMAVTGLGIVLGLAGGAALTRYLEKMLYGLTPLDPVTFVAVPALFILVAACACAIPTRRATMVDPVVTLRYE